MTGVPGTVGRPDWTLPRAPGRLKSERQPRIDTFTVPPLVARAVPFFALAFLASAHWGALVEPSQTGRALLVSAIVTIGGALIWLTASLPRVPGLIVRTGVLVVMTLLAVTAIGIRFKLLMPAGWGTLGDRLTGGLSVVGSVTEWPYSGPNVWLRLTTLLVAPLVLVIASAFAFWPRAKESRTAYGIFALVLLVALYSIAVAARPFEHQALRGIALLICLAAWLWLPRLRGRDAIAALGAIGVAGLAALILTPQFASPQPWVDYRHWSWTLHKERTIGFDWRHSYGPLTWPRKGRTLLLIKSTQAHYWKAETLDHFDGRGWTTTPNGENDPTFANRAITHKAKWLDTVHVTVRGLRSELVVGPGSLVGFKGLPGEPVTLSNGTFLLNAQLGSGDSYTVRGYTPDPTSKQMRAAAQPSPFFGRYTTVNLPLSDSIASVLHIPLRNQPNTGDPDAVAQLQGSRYARMYRLALQVAAGATTDYDIVRKVGAYLEDHYTYSEKTKNSQYPLEDFLFKTKKGYCQHFSGAAALMLRMLGIPVRVASGFAPGTLDSKTHEYVVRDLDAHSWIEVWFQGIGWVPFDPTPAQAPASSQAASFTPLSEIASAARGDQKDKLTPKLRAEILGQTSSKGGGAAGARPDGGTPWGWIAAGAVVLLLGIAAIVVTIVRFRRRRPLPPPCGDPDVDYLVRLLARLGLDIDPGTTLLELEARLQRLGGSSAAAYAKRLRRRRFGDGSEPAPDRAERRRLRHVLAGAVNAGPLTRVHLALPDAALLTRPFRRAEST
jgi:hypothetical protein